VRTYDVVDYWLREGEIKQKRREKERRQHVATGAAAKAKADAAAAASANPFDALSEATSKLSLSDGAGGSGSHRGTAAAAAPAKARNSNGRALSSASVISGAAPPGGLHATAGADSASDDEGEEDADEVKRTLAERAVDQAIQEVKYEMQEIKMAVCPVGYREPSAALLNAPDLFALSHFERQCLHWHWLSQWRQEILSRLEPAIARFEDINREIKEHHRLTDTSILKAAAVVGMTTTGAASLQQLVQQLKPVCVMMEEAAEVLEAHVLACLAPSVQHLMLIGDHKQLRPTTSHFDLTRLFKLDVSLFERMMLSNLEFKQLSTQRRMRPCIRELSSFHYKDGIEDGDNVKAYAPVVTGVSSPLYFLTHTEREGGDRDEFEKRNEFEANMAVRLAIYLCNSGHRPEDITILTTYKGQLRLITRTLHSLLPRADDPRRAILCRVVDKYQGEENKIIILSLVRSNGPQSASVQQQHIRNPLGFVNKDNRMCVALSRAKHGMYIFGNAAMLRHHSASWRTICERVESHQAMGTALPLYCPRHDGHARGHCGGLRQGARRRLPGAVPSAQAVRPYVPSDLPRL
jgi:hypothetical protein